VLRYNPPLPLGEAKSFPADAAERLIANNYVIDIKGELFNPVSDVLPGSIEPPP
jgi:hypothetical protein